MATLFSVIYRLWAEFSEASVTHLFFWEDWNGETTIKLLVRLEAYVSEQSEYRSLLINEIYSSGPQSDFNMQPFCRNIRYKVDYCYDVPGGKFWRQYQIALRHQADPCDHRERGSVARQSLKEVAVDGRAWSTALSVTPFRLYWYLGPQDPSFGYSFNWKWTNIGALCTAGQYKGSWCRRLLNIFVHLIIIERPDFMYKRITSSHHRQQVTLRINRSGLLIRYVRRTHSSQYDIQQHIYASTEPYLRWLLSPSDSDSRVRLGLSRSHWVDKYPWELLQWGSSYPLSWTIGRKPDSESTSIFADFPNVWDCLSSCPGRT